jgi:hypothetical protein
MQKWERERLLFVELSQFSHSLLNGRGRAHSLRIVTPNDRPHSRGVTDAQIVIERPCHVERSA